MKHIFLLAFIFFLSNASGPALITKSPELVGNLSKKTDSPGSFKWTCRSTFDPSKTAVFVNGKFEPSMDKINPNQIEEINTVMDSIQVNSIQYVWQIHMTMKDDYVPKKGQKKRW